MNPHRIGYIPRKQRGKWQIRLAEVALSLVIASILVALSLMYFDVRFP